MREDSPYILWVEESRIDKKEDRDASFLRLRRLHAAPFVRQFQNHFHTEIEIALFLSGRGTYIVNRQKYPIAPGDLFVCGSMEQHCFSSIDGPEELVFITVHFDPRFVWSRGGNMFDSRYLQVFSVLGRELAHRLPPGPMTHEISKLLLDMEQEFVNRQAEYEQMVKALLLRVLVLLNRMIPPNAANLGHMPSQSTQRQIEKSLRYIDAHLTEPLRLEEIAAQANMSPCYFSTLFKRLNLLSPWNYIVAKRVALACDMLTESTRGITETALACGFNNTANFNRAFRQVMDMTPREYRAGGTHMPEDVR